MSAMTRDVGDDGDYQGNLVFHNWRDFALAISSSGFA
jgi:hypothetical protein